MSARFTTIDPIRGGSNWFSYVVNDPVNYCDPFGLSASDHITIQKGDTLSRRTAQYNKENGTNYTWQEIGEYNHLENPNLIHPGDVIYFPGKSTTTTTTTATTATQTVASPTVTAQLGGNFGQTGSGMGNSTGSNGRIQQDALEYRFVNEVLGDKGVEISNSTSYIPLPMLGDDSRSASWDTFGGIIFLTSDIYFHPMATNEGRNTFIHELFHQIQYSEQKTGLRLTLKRNSVIPLPNNLRLAWKNGAFPALIGELMLNNKMAKEGKYNYTYDYGNLSKISKLSDLSFYESQAQLVGDFAEYYYAERYSSGVKYAWQKNDMKKMAEILNNSGYKTEAVNWVLENY